MNIESLTALQIPHVAYYLEHHGWVAVKTDDRRQIWRSRTGADVLLPLKRLRDFAPLLGQLVTVVAEDRAVSTDDVLTEVSWPGYDKLTARTRANATSSALPLDEAIEANDALRDLVVAAARSSANRQRSHRGGWSASVGQYFDQVRMIPSMPGSFTLRALLPINPESPEDIFFPELDTQSVRIVTRTMVEGISAARDAALQHVGGSSVEVFENVVEQGVSAELLDALVRLGGPEEHPNDLEIGIAWTYAAPAPPQRPILIGAGLMPVLAHGAAWLRSSSEEVPATITGVVTRLHRELHSGSGEVTVQGFLDSRAGSSTRSVKFELDEQSYQAAIAAHRDGDTVRVACTVNFGSPRMSVLAVRSFSVERAT